LAKLQQQIKTCKLTLDQILSTAVRIVDKRDSGVVEAVEPVQAIVGRQLELLAVEVQPLVVVGDLEDALDLSGQVDYYRVPVGAQVDHMIVGSVLDVDLAVVFLEMVVVGICWTEHFRLLLKLNITEISCVKISRRNEIQSSSAFGIRRF